MILNEDTILIYALKNYENKGCISKKEFKQDFDRIKYVKRLFRRYLRKINIDSLQVRLALNHIIILYNVFPGESATNILFYKLERELWPILKPFLVFLERLPDKISGVFEKELLTSNIKMDKKIIAELRKI